MDEVIKQANTYLDETCEFKKAYDLLVQYKDEHNVDILWRLTRAAYHCGQEMTDKEQQKQKYYEAFHLAEYCLKIDENHFGGHLWYAILLDVISKYESFTKKIKGTFKMREHFEKALELAPANPATNFAWGCWHFVFADMPWYQRKFASTIFSSTYEEALKFFKKAEEVGPNANVKNLLFLGKTYKGLGDKENAILYLKRARDYGQKSVDQRDAHDEAKKILNSLGVKEN